jgi:hypothetical protein
VVSKHRVQFTKGNNRYTEEEELTIKVLRKMFDVKPFSKEYIEQDRLNFLQYKKSSEYKEGITMMRRKTDKRIKDTVDTKLGYKVRPNKHRIGNMYCDNRVGDT